MRPTRVRRLRIRRAVSRSVAAGTLIAGAMFLMDLSASAGGGLVPPTVEVSPATARIHPALGTVTEMGVWATESPEAPALVAGAAGTMVDAEGRLSVRAVHVVALGKDHEVLTNAASVRQLLSAMGITPDANDRVTPALGAPISLSLSGDLPPIHVTEIDFSRVEVETKLGFGTDTRMTDDLAPGNVKIAREGETGRVLKTFRKKMVDGELVGKHLVHQKVLEAAVDRVKLVGEEDEPTLSAGSGHSQSGTATWYGRSGLTAAHPTLPMGTHVRVTNVANGKSVTVVIDDRGPYSGAIIDLSDDAFSQIADLSTGVINVRLGW